jgi:hypothetical protein
MAAPSNWKSAWLASFMLVGATFAGRLDRVARNKGFHPDALQALAQRSHPQAQAEQVRTKARYLNARTESTLPLSNPLHPRRGSAAPAQR